MEVKAKLYRTAIWLCSNPTYSQDGCHVDANVKTDVWSYKIINDHICKKVQVEDKIREHHLRGFCPVT